MDRTRDDQKRFMEELLLYLGGGEEKVLQEVLAARMKVSPGTLSNAINGKKLAIPTVIKMADNIKIPRARFMPFFGYTPSDEDLDEDKKNYNNKKSEFIEFLLTIGSLIDLRMPLKGSVSCGTPFLSEEEDGVTLAEDLSADYAVKVNGDSMEPYYHQGDRIIIRQMNGLPPRVGKKYIINLGSEVMCRILKSMDWEDGEYYVFAPANGKYPEIRKTAEKITFQGQVVGVITSEE